MAVLWPPFPAQPWAGGAEQPADCLGHVFHLSLLPALIQTSLTSHWSASRLPCGLLLEFYLGNLELAVCMSQTLSLQNETQPLGLAFRDLPLSQLPSASVPCSVMAGKSPVLTPVFPLLTPVFSIVSA